MSRQWMSQRERGSQFLIRLIAWIALHLGQAVGRALLYPISGYFLVFSKNARTASRAYLERILHRPPKIRELFRHYHCFASTILDRVYLLAGRYDRFQITVVGEELLLRQLRNGKGCILLGSHFGSFEVMRAQGIFRAKLPIKVLMYEDNSQKINAVLNAINPEILQSVIPIGRADTLIRAKEAIDGGSIVGILADRIASNDRVVHCRFLGQDAPFPAGPLLLAGILQVPVTIAFGIYRGRGRYEIHIEELAERIDLNSDDRLRGVQQWMQVYAQRLEYYCRQDPYNWFNFYDFWGKGP